MTQRALEADGRATLLLIDDTPSNLELLLEYLTERGFEVLVAVDGPTAIERAKLTNPDLILLDVMMPHMDGFETCRRLKALPETQDIPVLFMTALTDTENKVRGFSVGGVDYIAKPFQQEEVLARIETHLTLRRLRTRLANTNADLERQVAERTKQLSDTNEKLELAYDELRHLKELTEAENEYLREELGQGAGFTQIITQAPVMKQLLYRLEQVAATQATVLILGETGTGKELLASAVHEHSPRRDKPLVKVNCAALPENLIESELFGHERGAFTGAVATKAGRFELAHGGSIFLDEIGDLPLPLQSKLLRVLQEGEIQRLGSSHTRHVDVRVIAATNRDLAAAITRGEFREDLYYRLNVFPLENPPLRERLDDVPALVQHFVKKHARRVGHPVKNVPDTVVSRLRDYDWPGNVRELENVVARALIMSNGPDLALEDWPPARARRSATPPAERRESATPRTDDAILTAEQMKELEKRNIAAALAATAGKVSGQDGAAKLLGVKASTLQSRIKALGIKRSADA